MRSPKEYFNTMNESQRSVSDDETLSKSAYDRNVATNVIGGGLSHEVPQRHTTHCILPVESFETVDEESAGDASCFPHFAWLNFFVIEKPKLC